MLQTMPLSGHQPLELFAGALAALIRVVQQRARLAAAPDRHQQRVSDQLGCHAGIHRPADHPAREQIDHSCHVKPAFGRLAIGEVGDPLLVRPLGLELSVQNVRRHGRDLAFAFVLRQTPPERRHHSQVRMHPWTTFFNGDCASNKLTVATLPAA
jgi:hypothetical protein